MSDADISLLEQAIREAVEELTAAKSDATQVPNVDQVALRLLAVQAGEPQNRKQDARRVIQDWIDERPQQDKESGGDPA